VLVLLLLLLPCAATLWVMLVACFVRQAARVEEQHQIDKCGFVYDGHDVDINFLRLRFFTCVHGGGRLCAAAAVVVVVVVGGAEQRETLCSVLRHRSCSLAMQHAFLVVCCACMHA
jgi:hypothetical protein